MSLPEINEKMLAFAHKRSSECIDALGKAHPTFSLALSLNPNFMVSLYEMFGMCYLQAILDFRLELYEQEMLYSYEIGYNVKDPFPN